MPGDGTSQSMSKLQGQLFVDIRDVQGGKTVLETSARKEMTDCSNEASITVNDQLEESQEKKEAPESLINI